MFPEYEFNHIQLKSHRGVIIERVLERGSWENLRRLFSTVGEKQVAGWLRQHGYHLLSKRSFALWQLALDVQDYQAREWAIAAKKMDLW